MKHKTHNHGQSRKNVHQKRRKTTEKEKGSEKNNTGTYGKIIVKHQGALISKSYILIPMKNTFVQK